MPSEFDPVAQANLIAACRALLSAGQRDAAITLAASQGFHAVPVRFTERWLRFDEANGSWLLTETDVQSVDLSLATRLFIGNSD